MRREPKQYMHVKGGRVFAPTCKRPVLLPPDPVSSGPDIIVRKSTKREDCLLDQLRKPI